MKSSKNFIGKFLPEAIIFIFAVLICHYSGNRGIFPIDSFGHFDNGYRILLGDHPFKDYWVVSGPIIDYFQSLLFFLLGVNWQIYILNASLLNGLVSLVTYYLLKNLGLEKKLSFFYTICFSILAYPSSGTPFVDQHSTFLSILALYVFILAMKNNKDYLWFLIPILMTFSFLSKQVPAAYILIIIIMILIYHFIFNSKEKNLRILFILFISSVFIISVIYFFFKMNSINIQNFLDQYINFPRADIGKSRYAELSYDIKNIFLDYKFIYIVLILQTLLIFFSIQKKINFFSDISFKIFLISLLLFASLVQHLLVTKNQIFIFFLIPLFSGFAQAQLTNIKFKNQKYFTIFLIILCLATTYKYHYRFNVDRKFHELNTIDFSKSVEAKKLSNKLNGLQWITPGTKTKKQANEEIDYLLNVKKILKNDKKNKLIITNYSIFSILLDEKTNSYSRWYPGTNNSAFPTKGNIFFENYQKFIKNIILKKKIVNIYVLSDVNEYNLLNYINLKCLDRMSLENNILKFNVDRICLRNIKS